MRKITEIKGNSELFKELEIISQTIGSEAGGYGLRMQKSLQSLAMANALLHGRREVTKEDIDKILYLGNWMNYNFNPL